MAVNTSPVVEHLLALDRARRQGRFEAYAGEVASRTRRELHEQFAPGRPFPLRAVRESVFSGAAHRPTPRRVGGEFVIPCFYRVTLEELAAERPLALTSEDVCEWCFHFWTALDRRTARALRTNPANMCYADFLERAV